MVITPTMRRLEYIRGDGQKDVPAIYYTNKLSKGKDKAISLQAWTGPEGSRRMRLLDFKTTGT